MHPRHPGSSSQQRLQPAGSVLTPPSTSRSRTTARAPGFGLHIHRHWSSPSEYEAASLHRTPGGYGFGIASEGYQQQDSRRLFSFYRRGSFVYRPNPTFRDRLAAVYAGIISLVPHSSFAAEHQRSTARAGETSGQAHHRWNRRSLVYVVAASIIYLCACRLLIGRDSHTASLHTGLSSAEAISQTHMVLRKFTQPNKRRASRVPLPRAISRGQGGDHPIRNGLLEVDMSKASHPIYQLIRDARSAWDDKIARQSVTLREAVREYKRRHGRNPPKGFDQWWYFVVENNVQLPDEYDQIERDILPFRALSPDELRIRTNRASQFPDTYTLRVRKGSVRTSVTFDPREIHGAGERMKDQMALLQPVAKYLENLQAVYSVHDTPSVIVGWEHRRELLEHVEEDEYIDADDEIDLTLRGWGALCPQSSPIRVHLPGRPIANTSRSFISSHSSLMDLCQHPEAIRIHGALNGQEPRVSDILPLFSLAKTKLHSDILGIPTESYIDHMDIIPWSERTHERLLWRGSNTGAHFDEGSRWNESHRIRLIDLAMESVGELEVLNPPKIGTKKARSLDWTRDDKRAANEWYTDISFSGSPIQCDVETCAQLGERYDFLDRMSHEQALDYKYVLDVDGNAWSARFQRLLKSGSVVFKSTIMPEWWTDRIQPWIHYVPIQVDYSDLYDALAFFRGTPSHPNSGESALAEEIAGSARDYVDSYWRRADMTAYMFRLYLEWARLLAPRRWEMDFVYSDHMERQRT